MNAVDLCRNVRHERQCTLCAVLGKQITRHLHFVKTCWKIVNMWLSVLPIRTDALFPFVPIFRKFVKLMATMVVVSQTFGWCPLFPRGTKFAVLSLVFVTGFIVVQGHRALFASGFLRG
jgi:hypothetical protein